MIFLIASNCNLTVIQEFLLLGMACLGMVIFYLINILVLCKDKKIYYDNFFKVKYISTIRNESDDNKNNFIG